jgi:DNA-binding response OmpR family regulator
MKKILIIEDDQWLRASLVKMLSFENYEVIEAEDGTSGVQIAQECLPDLIICDVAMPVLDGFGVITKLHQDLLTAVIPVLFLTAKAEVEAQRRGLQLGAVGYLTKPFTIDELLDTIRAQLGE